MLNFIKGWFRTPSALSIAVQAHEEAKRRLLDHTFDANYHAKMVEFYRGHITSLEDHIRTDTGPV